MAIYNMQIQMSLVALIVIDIRYSVKGLRLNTIFISENYVSTGAKEPWQLNFFTSTINWKDTDRGP